MAVSFTIPGPPQGKARPRVCRIHGKSVTYTPRKTVEYEHLIKTSYNSVSEFRFTENTALEMRILALFPMPRNASKRVKKSMLDGDILPTKKPDCDNVIKVICDALNGVAYEDDKQIYKIHFEKKYAQNPCVIVKISNILEEKKCQEN